jgi:hypothetical protein
MILNQKDRRCQVIEGGTLCCDIPLRSVIFALTEKNGESIDTLMEEHRQNPFLADDADLPPCTTCSVYLGMKEDLYQAFDGERAN